MPETLGNLVNLRELDLSNNRLVSVPESLGSLIKLQELYLYRNQLASVPETLGNLIKLQVLCLHTNQLASVPVTLGNLVNLRKLSLSENQLTSVPKTLGHLVNLQELSLFSNQLALLPESLGNLKKLESLFLSKNRLAFVPDSLIDLFEGGTLREVYLHQNRIGIPPEILGPSIEDIYSHENQFLSLEHRKVAQNPTRIGRYLRQIQGGKAPRLNEAKLIVLGPGAAGKTTLVEMLVHDRYNRTCPTTHGIIITRWDAQFADFDPIRVNVWDFGGQEVQYSTHGFFMSERAVLPHSFSIHGKTSGQGMSSFIGYTGFVLQLPMLRLWSHLPSKTSIRCILIMNKTWLATTASSTFCVCRAKKGTRRTTISKSCARYLIARPVHWNMSQIDFRQRGWR